LLLLGVWLLAGREGYPPADDADRRLRRALRITAFGPGVALFLYHGFLEFVYRFRYASDPASPYFEEPAIALVASAVMLVVAFGLVLLPLLLFRHLRGLAKRARSAHLAEHCTIVGLGTSLTVLYVLAAALLMENHEHLGLPYNWVSRSSAAMALMLGIGTLGILFILWCLYLMIRFAFAFAKASRQLRRKWQEQDRSVVMGYER
jgi:hypothetical protein